MADEVYEGRNAEILESIINDTEYTDPPQSRIEELLLELKEVIEQGGGGSASLSDLIEDVTGYPLNDYASMSLYSKDLNTITKSGFYNAMTCTNAPFDYMTLTVIGYYLQGYTVQIACDVTTGEVQKRQNINGTWSAWATTKELPAVTTDDNDMVLTVKSGAWDKANVSSHNFDNTEKVVGTWFGEPLYERSWEFNSAIDCGSNDWTTLVSNISEEITIRNFSLGNSTGCFGLFEVGYENNGSISGFNGRSITKPVEWLTIQYTKTTD